MSNFNFFFINTLKKSSIEKILKYLNVQYLNYIKGSCVQYLRAFVVSAVPAVSAVPPDLSVPPDLPILW